MVKTTPVDYSGLSHAHCKTKPLAALTKEFKVSDKTLKGVMTRHGITECADYEYTPATGKAKAGKWKAKN